MTWSIVPITLIYQSRRGHVNGLKQTRRFMASWAVRLTSFVALALVLLGFIGLFDFQSYCNPAGARSVHGMAGMLLAGFLLMVFSATLANRQAMRPLAGLQRYELSGDDAGLLIEGPGGTVTIPWSAVEWVEIRNTELRVHTLDNGRFDVPTRSFPTREAFMAYAATIEAARQTHAQRSPAV